MFFKISLSYLPHCVKSVQMGVTSGLYFPVFGLDTEIYGVNLCTESEYMNILTRNNSVFGHISRSTSVTKCYEIPNKHLCLTV